MSSEHETDKQQQPDNAQEVKQESASEATPEDQAVQYQQEIARLKDMYLRAMAETENVRARAKRENEETAKYASTKFARDMVNILENLVRASSSITPEHRAGNEVVKQVGEGIDMTIQELVGIFERNGIKRIDPVREKFDHNFHQAVTQIETKDAAPGTVVQVLQAGYVMHDRLLRPAMVCVAKEPAESGTAENKVA